jgi:antitoxin component of MazEF toxin-antitoxin module
MPIKVKRILFRVGEGSLAVTLPKAWVIYNQLKPGDTVELIANDGVLINVKKEQRPEAVDADDG